MSRTPFTSALVTWILERISIGCLTTQRNKSKIMFCPQGCQGCGFIRELRFKGLKGDLTFNYYFEENVLRGKCSVIRE